MKETTTITLPYPPTSEIICALINKGWCIDGIERATCEDDFDSYVLTAHVIEVKEPQLSGDDFHKHVGQYIQKAIKWPREGE